MAANDCPCRFCVAPERHAGCHATCDKYKTWNAAHQEELAKLYAQRKADDDCFPKYRKHRSKGSWK